MISSIKLWKQSHEKLFRFFCFAILFWFFFLLSYISISIDGSFDLFGYIFYSDSPRVFDDWTFRYSNHYRTSVHPLYVLLNYPIFFILKAFCGGNRFFVVYIYNALFATINVYLFYKILSKLKPNGSKLLVVLFVLFYAFSFSMLENLMIIESYLIGATSILASWCFYVYFKDENFNIKHYIFLVVLGIFSLSVTITNFIHYLIVIAFLFIFKKQKNVKEFFVNLLKALSCIFATFVISFLLIIIQKKIFPSSENSFFYVLENIKALFTGNKEYGELEYSSLTLGLVNFKNIIKTFLGFAFVGGSFKYGNQTDAGGSFIMSPSPLTVFFILLVAVSLIFSVIMCIKKRKTIIIPFALALAVQVGLHLFYGNTELMLYALHFSFLILICIYIGFAEFSDKILGYIYRAFYAIICIEFVYNIVVMSIIINKIIKICSPAHYFCFDALLVFLINVLIFAILICIIYKFFLQKDRKPLKNMISKSQLIHHIVACILAIVILTINLPCVLFPVRNTVESRVLMGMGLREKYVVEKTTKSCSFYHYDVETKKKTQLLTDVKITSYEFDDQNYKVTLKTKDNGDIYVYENADGLYLERDGKVETLDDSQKINIPTFEGYSQQKLLKTLFYEVIVNVTKNGTTPNYLTYGNTWYRDGALMAMVLDATDNVSQIEGFFNNLTPEQMYDGARDGSKYDEPDNLGELLYILSLFDDRNQTLIDAIITEAYRIEQANGGNHHLSGLTDFTNFDYYETAWLMFGLDSLGLDTSYWKLENCTEKSRWDLMWFYKTEPVGSKPDNLKSIAENVFDISKCYYPYIDIAMLHYWEYKIEFPEDLSYPISFEYQDWGLKKQAKCAPHSWTASELFLYLLDYDTFE